MTEPRPRRVFSFGVYQCDVTAGELRKNGIKVKISDQPLRLLEILLERPGETFTRQELGERLWPEGTFVSFEDSLNTAVNKLRSALDDESENPRFVETVPRRGYRFVAPANVSAQDAGSPIGRNASGDAGGKAYAADGSAVLAAPKRIRKPQLLAWILGAPAVLLIAFTGWWYMPLPPPRLIRIDQITTTGRIDTPVEPFSDGFHAYYIERDGDHWNLMQASLKSGDAQRMDAPGMSAMVMDISPDESQLLVGSFEKRDGQNELWTMPVQGGSAKRLGNVDAASASFSPDGKQIAYSSASALWMMDADGNNSRKFVDLPGTPAWIAWSPDGQRLRFTLGTLFSGDTTSIWEVQRDGKNLRPILSGWTHPSSECCGTWTTGGRYYIFTSYRGGHANLWALRERGFSWRRSPRGPFQLTSGPDAPWGGVPSRDGKLVLFYNGVWHEQMQRMDLKTGKFSVPTSGMNTTEVDFSRDGKWISYVERGALMRSRVDGSEQVELAAASNNAAFPRWSPDGQWIAFNESVTGSPGESYLVPSTGGTPQALLPGNEETRDADWSADGRALVVSRALGPKNADGSRECELLIVDFSSRKAEAIPGSKGLAGSRWSPDGRFISATAADQSQLKLWDTAKHQWRVIAHGTALGMSVWSPDSRYLYFQDVLGKGEALSRLDVRSGKIEQVADFSETLRSGVDRCALFAIEPDGTPIIGLNRGAYDLFAARAQFP